MLKLAKGRLSESLTRVRCLRQQGRGGSSRSRSAVFQSPEPPSKLDGRSPGLRHIEGRGRSGDKVEVRRLEGKDGRVSRCSCRGRERACSLLPRRTTTMIWADLDLTIIYPDPFWIGNPHLHSSDTPAGQHLEQPNFPAGASVSLPPAHICAAFALPGGGSPARAAPPGCRDLAPSSLSSPGVALRGWQLAHCARQLQGVHEL